MARHSARIGATGVCLAATIHLAGCAGAAFNEEAYGPRFGGLVGGYYGYVDRELAARQYEVTYYEVGHDRAMTRAFRRAGELCAELGAERMAIRDRQVEAVSGIGATNHIATVIADCSGGALETREVVSAKLESDTRRATITASTSHGGQSDVAAAALALSAGAGLTVPATNSRNHAACTPLPPACQIANDEAIKLLDSFKRTNGVLDSVSEGYCAHLIGIEVTGFCADEYFQDGRSACAEASLQQQAIFQSNLPQLERSASQVARQRVRNACAWERP